jgi:hypothetical protein
MFTWLLEKGYERNRVSKLPFTVQVADLCLPAHSNKTTNGLRNRSKESNQNLKISIPAIYYFVVCNIKRAETKSVHIKYLMSESYSGKLAVCGPFD